MRRRTSHQELIQEEKGKPGASHHHQQAVAADIKILAAKLQATG
jgi:hypothetical protein